MLSYNRILVIVLVGIWICCWAAVAVFTIFFPGAAIDAANSVTGFFEKDPDYARLTFGLVEIGLVLGGVAFLVVGLAPPRSRRSGSRRGMIPLVSVGGGITEVTVGAIAEYIKHDVEGLDQVVKAEAEVVAQRNAMIVHLHLVTEYDTDLVAKTEEACQAVRERVENKIGVRLEQLTVSIDPRQHPTQV